MIRKRCGKEIHEKEAFCSRRIMAALAAAVVLIALCILCYRKFLAGDSYQCMRNMKRAERCLAEGEYGDALDYYKKVLEIDDTVVEAYISLADIYLTNGDCLSALQTLIDGGQITGDAELSEREAYLREHIVVINDKRYVNGRFADECKQQYDANGNQIKQIRYDDDGSVEKYLERAYDESGNLLKEIYWFEGCTLWHYEYAYTYDESGNQVKQIKRFYDDGSASCTESVYDESGNLLRYFGRNDDGSVSGWHDEYVYDESGNLLEEIQYDNDGAAYVHNEYVYDESGNLLKETYYGDDGSVAFYNEYAYDESGNLLKKIYYDSDGSVDSYFEYIYDESGNQLKETCYNDDESIAFHIEYAYDESGNLLKETHYGSDGSAFLRDEYAYDESGNLLKETHYGDDKIAYKHTAYVYDEAGNQVKEISYHGDGIIDWWECDILGNKVIENDNGRFQKHFYQYAYIGEQNGGDAYENKAFSSTPTIHIFSSFSCPAYRSLSDG